jgi:four helix bundle protein
VAYHQRFEDLPVWQVSMVLADRIFALTGSGCLKGHAGLRDQLERAVLSISNNIAEGFERGTTEELIAFAYYARGSAGEVRSMLRFLERHAEWADRREDVAALIDLALNTSRQLGGWLESLKNAKSRGPKYQNDASRRASEAARRAEACMAKLRRIQEEAKNAPHRDPGGAEAPE